MGGRLSPKPFEPCTRPKSESVNKFAKTQKPSDGSQHALLISKKKIKIVCFRSDIYFYAMNVNNLKNDLKCRDEFVFYLMRFFKKNKSFGTRLTLSASS